MCCLDNYALLSHTAYTIFCISFFQVKNDKSTLNRTEAMTSHTGFLNDTTEVSTADRLH